jgi:hypothetical protein
VSALPSWGFRPAAQRAADAGATLLWGARAIARGLDIPWDRQAWSGPQAARTTLGKALRKSFCARFLDDALVKARAQAPHLRDEEVIEVQRTEDTDGHECVLVARNAGGYVYLTAARVPAGTSLLEAP